MNPWTAEELEREDRKHEKRIKAWKKARTPKQRRRAAARSSRPKTKEQRRREKRRERVDRRNKAFLAINNYENYEAYLRSPDWAFVKKAYYRDRSRLQECLVCAAKRFQLHHKDYARCGKDALNHLIPLCGVCHRGVHDVLTDRGWPVTETRSAVAVYAGWLSEGELSANWRRLRVGRGRNRRKVDRPDGGAGSQIRSMPTPTEIRFGKSLRKIRMYETRSSARESGVLASPPATSPSYLSTDESLQDAHLRSIAEEI